MGYYACMLDKKDYHRPLRPMRRRGGGEAVAVNQGGLPERFGGLNTAKLRDSTQCGSD